MGEAKKILVVDDEPDAVEFVKTVLSREDWEVVSAEDGQAGLEAAVADPPDLIILDVQMPKKDGFEVFFELQQKETTRSIPVIMLTAVGQRTGLRFSAGEMDAYMDVQPQAYVEKPIDPSGLINAVRKALA